MTKLERLRQKILSYAFADEEWVNLPKIEEDIDRLLSDGLHIFPDIEYVVDASMQGRPGQCHLNSAGLWDANSDDEDVVLWTGYALANNVWVQHSWVTHEESGVLYETTDEPRDAYFGFPLTHEEARAFYWEQTI